VIKGIDYIGVGVGAIILRQDRAIFLAKRGSEAQNERHRWEFPGGGVEFGESLHGALIREIQEEYGFSISVIRLLDVVNHILPDERQHWVSPTYLCKFEGGTPGIREPHKCEAIGWFLIESLPIDHFTTASRSSFFALQRFLSHNSLSELLSLHNSSLGHPQL
jgi:mutator protein MutT